MPTKRNEHWIVYKHTSLTSGKSYIGLTSYPVRKRFREHIAYANAGSNFHFHSAIRLYGREDFESEVLHDNISTVREAELLEMSCILKYDTFENGYNSTIGGAGKSNKNKSRMPYRRRKKSVNAEVFTMIHKSFGTIIGSRVELAKIISVSRQNVGRVIRGERTHIHGWKLIVEDGIVQKGKI